MSKIKMLLLVIILSLLTIAFAGCQKRHTVTFIGYDGEVLKTQEVPNGQDAEAPAVQAPDGLEFVGWSADFKDVETDLKIEAVFYGITYAKKLKPDFNYAGKEFIRDGMGIVSLAYVIDGDTIAVRTPGTDDTITIRFHGINTPESTGDIEPWGHAASQYAHAKLDHAASILLEAEGARKDSSGHRWLAWVWYKETDASDYRLFNLEEIEMAYTKYSFNRSSKYFNLMMQANDKAKASLKKVWGEKDPDYNYSREVIPTTLLNLYYNHDKYKAGTVFFVKVRLVRTVGNSAFVEDSEAHALELNEGESVITDKGGFYIFWGYKVPFYRNYRIGEVFTMECKLEWQGQFGTQLTAPNKASLPIQEETAEVKIPVISASDIAYEDGISNLKAYEGRVITLTGLKCLSVNKTYHSDDGSYSYNVIMENAKNTKIDLYFNKSLIVKWKADTVLLPGHVYRITGGVSYYEFANGKYQLSVGDSPRKEAGQVTDLIRNGDIVEVAN